MLIGAALILGIGIIASIPHKGGESTPVPVLEERAFPVEVVLLPDRVQVKRGGDIDTLFISDNIESIWMGEGVMHLSNGKHEGYYISASVSGRTLVLMFKDDVENRDRAYRHILEHMNGATTTD